MPGRQFNPASYRYGFNGKEDDNEVKGQGNQIDYGMRGYDPRLGRFLSVDLLTKKYPWYTPYQFAGNTPIQAKDVDGLEPAYFVQNQQTGETVFQSIASSTIISRVPNNANFGTPDAKLCKNEHGLQDVGDKLSTGGKIVAGVGVVACFVPVPGAQVVGAGLIELGTWIGAAGTAATVTGDVADANGKAVLIDGAGIVAGSAGGVGLKKLIKAGPKQELSQYLKDRAIDAVQDKAKEKKESEDAPVPYIQMPPIPAPAAPGPIQSDHATINKSASASNPTPVSTTAPVSKPAATSN